MTQDDKAQSAFIKTMTKALRNRRKALVKIDKEYYKKIMCHHRWRKSKVMPILAEYHKIRLQAHETYKKSKESRPNEQTKKS